MIKNNVYESFCKKLKIKILPKVPKNNLEDYLGILNYNISSEDVFYACQGLFLLISSFFLFSSFLLSFLGFGFVEFLFFGLVFSGLICFSFWSYPVFKAKMRIVDSLSKSPLILTQLVSYLKLSPNIEWAIKNSTKNDEGFLARELRGIVKKSFEEGGIKRHLNDVALTLGAFSPAFKRCLFLVRMSLSEANVEKRRLMLDKGLRVFFEEIRINIQDFSQKLVNPSLIIFSFGTILPLVVISILPLLNVFGKSVSLAVVLGLLLVLNALTLLYTSKILMEKPVLVSNEHYPSKRFNPVIFCASLIVFFVVSFPGFLFLLLDKGVISLSGLVLRVISSLSTIPIVLGVSFSLSVYFFLSSRTLVYERFRMEKLEGELADVVYSIASELDDGKPIEKALLSSSENSSAKDFSSIIKRAWGNMKNSNLSFEDAFFDERKGALRDVKSKRIRSIFRFIINSENQSGVLASTLFAMHEHMNDLRNVEVEVKSKISNSLSMIKNTVVFFAPMITALVVVLNNLIEKSLFETKARLDSLGYNLDLLTFFGSSSLNSSLLQLVCGLYLVIFAFVMVRFIVFIIRGEDNNVLKYELSRILPIAALIYAFALLMSKNLLGV